MSTGQYHKHNFLKLRIMNLLYVDECYKDSDDTYTTKEISKVLKVPHNQISRVMSNYVKKRTKYFIRLKPVKGSREYRYQISSIGIKWYGRYMQRLLNGFDLNCRDKAPKQMPHYTGVRVSKEEFNKLVKMDLDQNMISKYTGLTRAGVESAPKSDFELCQSSGE